MSDELGREPTDDEVGEEIGIASEQVTRLKTFGIRPTSLDATLREDDSTEFGETIGDADANTPFELLRDKNLLHEMDGLLDVLDKREMIIISQRFGLDGGGPKTLENVAKHFGITWELIRQLQNIALAKVRCASARERTRWIQRWAWPNGSSNKSRPSKVVRPVPSPVTAENPTTVDWVREDSR